LRNLAETGQRADDRQKKLFDSDDILAAYIITGYGEHAGPILPVKYSARSEPGGAWFPPVPTTEHAVITIWGGSSVQYELQVRGRDQKLRGFQLFLDADALQALEKVRS
jgi:hypothetical protein